MIFAFPVDIKFIIATHDEAIWWLYWQYDPEFNKNTRNENARKLYIDRFTEQIKLDDRTEYRLFGKRHRENDLPAVIYDNGNRSWYINDKAHRENDKPAIISADGNDLYWIKYGLIHRENDLPAIVTDISKSWWYNGRKHRRLGYPSTIYYWGRNEYYYYGMNCKFIIIILRILSGLIPGYMIRFTAEYIIGCSYNCEGLIFYVYLICVLALMIPMIYYVLKIIVFKFG